MKIKNIIIIAGLATIMLFLLTACNPIKSTEHITSLDKELHRAYFERSKNAPEMCAYACDNDDLSGLPGLLAMIPTYDYTLTEYADGSKKAEWNSFVLSVFNLETGDLHSEYDMLKLIDETAPGFKIAPVGPALGIYPAVNDAGIWLVIKDQTERLYFSLLLQSGKKAVSETSNGWVDQIQKEEDELYYPWKRSLRIFDSDVCNFPELNAIDEKHGFTIFNNLQSLIIKLSPVAKLTDSIKELLPGIQTVLEDGKNVTIQIEEMYDVEKILKLMLPDGVTFDGCVMNGEYTIDGEDHPVGNMSDFKKWYNTNAG